MIATFPNSMVVEYKSAPFVRLKDSIEFYGKDRLTYNENGKAPNFEEKGVPDVWRFGIDGKRSLDHVALTEDIQHWMFRIMLEVQQGYRFASEQSYKDYWKSLPKSHQFIGWFTSVLRGNGSHTNRAGFGEKPAGNIPARNYINGDNPENGVPKFFHIVTGRWVAKQTRNVTKNIAGIKCLPVEVINISKGDYKNYHPFTHPHLFDPPLITGRYMVKDPRGGVKITGYFRQPYGQFGNTVTLPVMAPFDSEVWLPVAQIVEPSDTMPGAKF